MHWLKRNVFFFLLSCLFLLSCEQGKQGEYSIPIFKQEFKREFEIIGQELDLGRVSSITSYKGNLILVGQNRWTRQYLQVVDKKTGKILHSSVAFGRGPGEVLTQPWYSQVGQECYLYDPALEATQVYDLEKILQGGVGYGRTIRELNPEVSPLGIFYGPEGKVYFSNESFTQRDSSRTVSRIILEHGLTRFTYNEYPVSDRVRTWWMYMTPYLTFSPDFSKMAVVPAYGAILERFSLAGGISLLGADRFIEPDFILKNNNPDFSEHAIPYGFSNLTSTNERIIVGMVEDVVSGTGTRNQEFPRFPVLAVFDWNGRPLIRIRNSLNIECLGYDEEEDVIYAVARDIEDSRYLGRMKL